MTLPSTELVVVVWVLGEMEAASPDAMSTINGRVALVSQQVCMYVGILAYHYSDGGLVYRAMPSCHVMLSLSPSLISPLS